MVYIFFWPFHFKYPWFNEFFSSLLLFHLSLSKNTVDGSQRFVTPGLGWLRTKIRTHSESPYPYIKKIIKLFLKLH